MQYTMMLVCIALAVDISVDYAKSISKRVERVISSDNVALCFSTLYLSSFPLDTLLCTFSLLYVFHKNCSQVWNKNNSDFFCKRMYDNTIL